MSRHLGQFAVLFIVLPWVWSGPADADKEPVVDVTVEGCATITKAGLRRHLSIASSGANAPLPPATAIVLRCHAAGASLQVVDRSSDESVERQLSLDDLMSPQAPRLIAMVAAELLRAYRSRRRHRVQPRQSDDAPTLLGAGTTNRNAHSTTVSSVDTPPSPHTPNTERSGVELLLGARTYSSGLRTFHARAILARPLSSPFSLTWALAWEQGNRSQSTVEVTTQRLSISAGIGRHIKIGPVLAEIAAGGHLGAAVHAGVPMDSDLVEGHRSYAPTVGLDASATAGVPMSIGPPLRLRLGLGVQVVDSAVSILGRDYPQLAGTFAELSAGIAF